MVSFYDGSNENWADSNTSSATFAIVRHIGTSGCPCIPHSHQVLILANTESLRPQPTADCAAMERSTVWGGKRKVRKGRGLEMRGPSNLWVYHSSAFRRVGKHGLKINFITKKLHKSPYHRRRTALAGCACPLFFLFAHPHHTHHHTRLDFMRLEMKESATLDRSE